MRHAERRLNMSHCMATSGGYPIAAQQSGPASTFPSLQARIQPLSGGARAAAGRVALWFCVPSTNGSSSAVAAASFFTSRDACGAPSGRSSSFCSRQPMRAVQAMAQGTAPKSQLIGWAATLAVAQRLLCDYVRHEVGEDTSVDATLQLK